MNRTSLSVIALAVGAVLIIGLYNVYKPQVKGIADKVFNKVHMNNMVIKTGHYDGLEYSEDNDGNIEIMGGTLRNNIGSSWYFGHGLLAGDTSPKAFKSAKSVKIDDNVNLDHLTDVDNMFANDPRLESVDLGDNFDTSNVNNSRYGLDSMFEHDPNLQHVNLGAKFNKQGNLGDAYWNMFLGDKKLGSIQGNYSQPVKKAFDHRFTPFPGSFETE